MKKVSVPVVFLCMLLSSCSLLRMLKGKEKSGCPIGRNIGAERIASGDPVAIKAAKKAGNKKSDKGLLY
jgi:hypothetical protein